MSAHNATIQWTRTGDFLRGRYSREHTWTFDGGLTVPASPSPHVVPAPWSNPANVDPERQVARIYGATEAREQYYCNFGVNPDCVPLLCQGPLRVVGSDTEGEVRVVELPGHPFFIGTLFVPQARSTPQQPHPLVTAFLQRCVDRSSGHAQVGAETAGRSD